MAQKAAAKKGHDKPDTTIQVEEAKPDTTIQVEEAPTPPPQNVLKSLTNAVKDGAESIIVDAAIGLNDLSTRLGKESGGNKSKKKVSKGLLIASAFVALVLMTYCAFCLIKLPTLLNTVIETSGIVSSFATLFYIVMVLKRKKAMKRLKKVLLMTSMLVLLFASFGVFHTIEQVVFYFREGQFMGGFMTLLRNTFIMAASAGLVFLLSCL